MPTKSVLFKFWFGWGELQPGSPHPSQLCPLSEKHAHVFTIQEDILQWPLKLTDSEYQVWLFFYLPIFRLSKIQGSPWKSLSELTQQKCSYKQQNKLCMKQTIGLYWLQTWKRWAMNIRKVWERIYTVRLKSFQTKAVKSKKRRRVFFSVYLFKIGSISCNTQVRMCFQLLHGVRKVFCGNLV